MLKFEYPFHTPCMLTLGTNDLICDGHEERRKSEKYRACPELMGKNIEHGKFVKV